MKSKREVNGWDVLPPTSIRFSNEKCENVCL
jgi:hypothetical protein